MRACVQVPLQLEPAGSPTTPSGALTGVLIKLMQSPAAGLRSQAVACLNLLAREMPKPLIELFDEYLQAGFVGLPQRAAACWSSCSARPRADVGQRLCVCLVLLWLLVQ